MAAMKGKGTQKEARLERLKAEITTYIEDRPGCSAADIVAYLSNERKMRNHGLTARTIGYFIPRHMKTASGANLMQRLASVSITPWDDQTFNGARSVELAWTGLLVSKLRLFFHPMLLAT